MTHVVYGIDDKYIPPCLVSIYSLLNSTSTPVRITVYMAGPAEGAGVIRKLVRQFAHGSVDILPFVTDALSNYSMSEIASRFSAASMIPLFIPWMVDGKCLFLDADTVICKDISLLYDVSLNGKMIGACLPPGMLLAYRKYSRFGVVGMIMPFRAQKHRKQWNRTANATGFELWEIPEKYFSSGVMLMDTTAIKKADPDGKLMDMGDAERTREGVEPDMECLNRYFKDKTHYLHQRWNLSKDLSLFNRFICPGDLWKEYILARKDPGIVHYANIYGRRSWNRPWYRERRRYRMYKRICREIEEKTGIAVRRMFNERCD